MCVCVCVCVCVRHTCADATPTCNFRPALSQKLKINSNTLTFYLRHSTVFAQVIIYSYLIDTTNNFVFVFSYR